MKLTLLGIKRLDTVEELYISVINILSGMRIKKVYKAVVDEASKLVGAEYGSIFIGTKEITGTKKIEKIHLHRIYSSEPKSEQLEPRKKGYTKKAFIEQEVFVINQKALKKIHPETINRKVKSIVIIPLLTNNESIGVLTLQSKKDNYFDNKKIQILKLFGTIVSLKIKQEQLYDQKRQDLRVREQFSALASHEIKTPLAVISMYAQLMQKKLQMDEEIKEDWVNIIFSETQRMTQIINEFLTARRISSGELQYTWSRCNIAKIIKKIIEDYKITHPKQKILLKLQSKTNQSTLKADENKLKQVFINIINNAIKFSKPNDPININISLERGYVVTKIEDHGTGISEEHLPHIFDPFYKGNNKKAGMGMGLFLSKNVIETHGGTVEIKSTKDKGTAVTIKLPKTNKK